MEGMRVEWDISLSSLALDYNFNLHPRLLIGIHTDTIVE